MAEQRSQSRENHARLHPPYHFFLAPAILLLLVLSVYELVRVPGIISVTRLLLVLVVTVIVALTRAYPLKVQDRVIRLEERLRLVTLLPSHLLPTIGQLSEPQLIALRFASDEELPALAERARTEQLEPKAIKAAIKNWRPDYWRV